MSKLQSRLRCRETLLSRVSQLIDSRGEVGANIELGNLVTILTVYTLHLQGHNPYNSTILTSIFGYSYSVIDSNY